MDRTEQVHTYTKCGKILGGCRIDRADLRKRIEKRGQAWLSGDVGVGHLLVIDEEHGPLFIKVRETMGGIIMGMLEAAKLEKAVGLASEPALS